MSLLSMLEQLNEVSEKNLDSFQNEKFDDGDYTGFVENIRFNKKDENTLYIMIDYKIENTRTYTQFFSFKADNPKAFIINVKKIMKLITDLNETAIKEFDSLKFQLIESTEGFVEKAKGYILGKNVLITLETKNNFQNANVQLEPALPF